jgi:hypothetical protein
VGVAVGEAVAVGPTEGEVAALVVFILVGESVGTCVISVGVHVEREPTDSKARFPKSAQSHRRCFVSLGN